MYTADHVRIRTSKRARFITVTIPSYLSEQIKLKDGDEIRAEFDDSGMAVETRRARVEEVECLSGCLKDVDIENSIAELRETKLLDERASEEIDYENNPFLKLGAYGTRTGITDGSSNHDAYLYGKGASV